MEVLNCKYYTVSKFKSSKPTVSQSSAGEDSVSWLIMVYSEYTKQCIVQLKETAKWDCLVTCIGSGVHRIVDEKMCTDDEATSLNCLSSFKGQVGWTFRGSVLQTYPGVK